MSPKFVVMAVLTSIILCQIGLFAVAEAEKTPDFGLQRSQGVHETEQNTILDSRTQLKITTKNGFNSVIDLVVTVDPPNRGVEATINGKTSLTIDPKKENAGLSVHVSDDAPDGDYKVTITGTSIINGKKVERITFFTVKVKPPSEFFLKANPSSITIPQGGSGFTTVKATATKSFKNPINLEVWFKSTGFSSKFSGDGQLTMEMITQSFTEWFIEPKQGKPTNTKLEIKVNPHVAPGTYYATIEGTMQNVQFGAPKHSIPLTIHVTANPEFAHLQVPTLFDMDFEHRQETVQMGSMLLNDITVWSERPDETITFTVSVSPPNKGVSADINQKRIIPNKLPATGVFVMVAVSDSAEPGKYTVILTGVTSTLSGKELTQSASFDVIVPEKNKKTVEPKNSEQSLIQNDPSKSSTIKKAEFAQIRAELGKLYQISKHGEKLASLIKNANDDESKALKKMSGDIKSVYSKTKNTDAKKLDEKIQKQIKDAEVDKKQISAIDSASKKITKQIISIAKDNDIKKTELDKIIKNDKKNTDSNKPQSLNKIKEHYVAAYNEIFDDDEMYRTVSPTASAIADYWDNVMTTLPSDPEQISEDTIRAIDPSGLSSIKKESILDDLDPTIRGPDVNESKEKPNTEENDPNAPPESILDDVDTDYAPDARAPKEKPKTTPSGIDHRRIALDDMLIIEQSLAQELQDYLRDKMLQIDLERQLKDLKQKITITDTKKPIIQKDPTKLPETKTDTKPKSTQPEKTEKPVIQKDPTITKPSNTKPTLSIPKQVTYEATGPSGANVVFSTSSQDKEDGSLIPVCTPTSGSTFPIGTTSVSCTVTDSNNNSVSGSFTITVRDTTPPAFAPFQPTEGVRDDSGVQVFFDVTANDLVDGNVPVSCNYQSGYKFPPGVTELKCTASDSRGNQSTKTVQITVTVTESGQ
ncbi:HYR domain-containing protein [Candidatus Nitrosotenuis cloacae]|uniref:HYR domain-containing protein n=1 Tax=Candidatus Nitrosotenuis cloacae TaxID=1603555 RepID=A0A3G1B2Z8_9ARCH|nr:HYR domain-containing protein [Candidatus Nitrosotenuis cloacae]AJZ75301.2 hypothetical protein SU86_001630 [Candidatus Nitrosotenuis cloacae]